MKAFPEPRPGVLYLTEGGTETELMYKHGHELPEFAVYPLLDNRAAVEDLTDMYTSYLEVVAQSGCAALIGGLDYRASLDWASKLGISASGLAEFQLRSIQFLRDVSLPFHGQISEILIAGVVGPRGDAYGRDDTITASEAEEYHAAQLATLRIADVDLVSALTFNNIPEAVGVARAAANVELPLCVSFMVDKSGRLLTGPTLHEAIETVDAQAGDARPTFYGINCSHPTEFDPALVDHPALSRIRSLRPNASAAEKQALCEIGHLESGDPVALAAQVASAVGKVPQVDIVGGCCGTWDDHLRAIVPQLVLTMSATGR